MSRDFYIRKLKLQSLLREEISDIIFSELKDPRVKGTLISRVEISSNLTRAKIFIVPHGENKKEIEGLKSAAGFIRNQLKKRLRLKIIPEISFAVDREYSTDGENS